MRATLSIIRVWIFLPANAVSKVVVFSIIYFRLSDLFIQKPTRYDNTLSASHFLLHLSWGGVKWKISFINRDTNQFSLSFVTTVTSTIRLIILQWVSIALWLLSIGSCNDGTKSKIWITVGWLGLTCFLLQHSNQPCTDVIYSLCQMLMMQR